jgi:hypothetical protein
LIGQGADLAGHDGEPASLLPGPRRFNGSVQGQQVGLLGDVGDRGGNLADGLGLLGQGQDVFGGRLDLLLDRAQGGGRFLHHLAAGSAGL